MSDDERIVLVDLNDNCTGVETKKTVHEKGLLHRAFSVFIINDGKMLLQKRNSKKYHSGGLWSNACCSHQRENEELNDAVKRRIKEELGIECKLDEIFSFVYKTEFSNGLTEYELDHVFLGKYEGEIIPDEDEIEDIDWVHFDDLIKRVKNNPDDFSFWFKESFKKVIDYIK